MAFVVAVACVGAAFAVGRHFYLDGVRLFTSFHLPFLSHSRDKVEAEMYGERRRDCCCDSLTSNGGSADLAAPGRTRWQERHYRVVPLLTRTHARAPYSWQAVDVT